MKQDPKEHHNYRKRYESTIHQPEAKDTDLQ